MKKTILFISIISLFSISFAQTIVSTEIENKNIVLEEFTGMHCVNCPQGHAIAQSIKDANPNDVFLINIHTGSYATPLEGEPDFRTNFGNEIALQAEVSSYPSGSVNRHFFEGMSQSGTGTAMERNYWETATNQILEQESYVNIAVESEIDVQTREITIHVEAYYTGDSPESTNYLNIALLQNNTLGPQSGGGAGNEYIHMHRLVHLITNQWGEEISPTSSGTFINQTYTYTIPLDYREVPVKLVNMEVVAFISETHQEIITGNACMPTFTNFEYSNDANLLSINNPTIICGTSLYPIIDIQNMGSNEITSIEIDYSINSGTVETYNFIGSILPLHTQEIILSEIHFIPENTNTLEIAINQDDNEINNSQILTFEKSLEAINTIYLDILTDNYGSELSWEISGNEGIVASGGPYINGSQVQINESFNLPNGCYVFSIEDAYDDGISPTGHVFLTDSEGLNLMNYPTGDYGTGDQVLFSTANDVNISETGKNEIIIYPNPVNNIINIDFIETENYKVSIYNVLGKTIKSQLFINTKKATINANNLEAGIYFIKIETEKSIIIKQISLI